jgi:enterochelin esterase-like enzyme
VLLENPAASATRCTAREIRLKYLVACLFASWMCGVAVPAAAAEPLPTVAVGRVERLPAVASKFVDARHVDVWLPRGYSPATRHAVVYMHDGQMLFDATTTWNHQAWNVQDTVQRLIDAGQIPPTLIVGIWNNGKYRHSEYFPQKYLPGMPEPLRAQLIKDNLQGKPQSDAYLRFLVEELKPAIDAKYATRTDAASTVLMGSSMGGLISVYAMNEYPGVFGGAAGLSTHWVGTFKPNAAVPLAAFNYLRSHLADPATHRLYQDHGTIELDAMYAPYQVMVDDLARERGYVDGANFETRVFEGTGHNETAWAARLEIPLRFLLGQR